MLKTWSCDPCQKYRIDYENTGGLIQIRECKVIAFSSCNEPDKSHMASVLGPVHFMLKRGQWRGSQMSVVPAFYVVEILPLPRKVLP